MWGNLAAVMAQGMRGKRIADERGYERDQDLIAHQERQTDRREDRERAVAQDARQAEQDRRVAAREATMTPLEIELMRARIANEQAPRPTAAVSWREREDASGRLIQVNPQTGEVRPLTMDGRPVQGRAPARPVDTSPKPRALNAIQDTAGDYVARFSSTADPTERARLAYQEALKDGHRPQPGENPGSIWTAFLAASQRQAGATRPPAANDTRAVLAEQLLRMGGGTASVDSLPVGPPRHPENPYR